MLYIGLAVLGFYIIGFILDLAAWALDITLTVGLVLVVIALINKFYESRNSAKK
jgi:membrane protein implicated in regulation of membrane protease activity